MDLFKDFTRGQENAQDQLNDNFEKIEDQFSPKTNAVLNHFLGINRNAVINDFKNSMSVTSSGLNLIVDTGACVVYGRLFQNEKKQQIQINANESGFLCVSFDLSISENGKLEVVDSLIKEDLNEGGQVYTFPLASYSSNENSVTFTKSDTSPTRKFDSSIGTDNNTLWDTGLLHFSANKGDLTSGAFWTSSDNFPRGMSYTLITDTTGYTNAPFTNASYIITGNGYFFSVLALQTNGTGIKYITGISSSTGLTWQTVK